MKPTILLLLFTHFAFAQNSISFSKDELKRINPLLSKGVKITNDEHEGISWIKSKTIKVLKSDTFSSTSIEMSIYFGITKVNDQVRILPMRITNRLFLSDWIFFDKISILSGTLKEKKQGLRKKFTIVDEDTQRNTKGIYVIEKSDVIANSEMMEFIDIMANDPKPFSIRYSGDDKYFEKFIGVFLKKYKTNFKPVLDSYNSLLKEFSI